MGDDFAAVYEATAHRITGPVSNIALDIVGVGPGTRIVDIAAGAGALSGPAAERGAAVLATDIAPGMVRRLAERLRPFHRCEAREMDGEAFPGRLTVRQDMEQVLQLIVVFFAALATGGLMVNWIGLGRAMSRLSVSPYVEFHQATNHTFDPYMPIVVVGAVLGGILLAILFRGIHSLSGELAIVGSVGYAAVIAITLLTNVRINKQVARWSVQSPPDDWTLIRASWVRFHIIRTLFSLPALACYILACFVSR
jgi:uncharacterized membrane protein